MKKIFAIASVFIGFSMVGQAAVIFDATSALTISDPIQLGRLSRNNVPQDWSGSEAFPGVLNPTTSYYYTTFSINVSSFSYIQIDMDSVSANTFASAYLTSYLPDSEGSPNYGFDTNWLGDEGASGNFFGTDPRFFQVIVPVGQELVVVVNNTAAGGVGLGDPFHLTVEGYYDSSFDDTLTTPEPASLLLVGGGLGLAGLIVRRRKATS